MAQAGARTPTGLVKMSIMERGILFLVTLWEGKWVRSEEQVWAASHKPLIYAELLRTTPQLVQSLFLTAITVCLNIYKIVNILQPHKGSQITSMFHSPIRDKHFIKNKEILTFPPTFDQYGLRDNTSLCCECFPVWQQKAF